LSFLTSPAKDFVAKRPALLPIHIFYFSLPFCILKEKVTRKKQAKAIDLRHYIIIFDDESSQFHCTTHRVHTAPLSKFPHSIQFYLIRSKTAHVTINKI
jgi:hypothetical protein